MWWHGIGFTWWGPGMMFLMMISWGVLIALIVWVIVRFARSRDAHTGNTKDALDIAKERYARGEITREQFEQLKKDLGGLRG